MSKFHVNPKTGNTGICRAKKDGCPFGSESEHFDNRVDAQKAYETKQDGFEQLLYRANLKPQKTGIVSSEIPWEKLNWKVVTIEQMASSSNGERFFAITTEEEFLIAANEAYLDVNSPESIREEFDEDPDDFIIQSMVRNKNGSYTAHQSSGSGRGDKYTVEYPAGTSFVIDASWDSRDFD